MSFEFPAKGNKPFPELKDKGMEYHTNAFENLWMLTELNCPFRAIRFVFKAAQRAALGYIKLHLQCDNGLKAQLNLARWHRPG